jgi:hypothetical protein
MRQRKPVLSREERAQLKNQAVDREFIGTCSSCRDKGVKVIKLLNAQVCKDKCLVRITERRAQLSGTVALQQANPNAPDRVMTENVEPKLGVSVPRRQA